MKGLIHGSCRRSMSTFSKFSTSCVVSCLLKQFSCMICRQGGVVESSSIGDWGDAGVEGCDSGGGDVEREINGSLALL